MPALDDGIPDTELPASDVVSTDVLVIGSGTAGTSAALMLSTRGIGNILITKYRWTANSPRAHLTNQRALEVLRDLGIEDQVHRDASEHRLIGDTVVCTSLAGEEIGRIHTWGTHPAREADYQLASPCLSLDIPQNYLEPILVRNATTRGTLTRFSTEYVSLEQDDDGIDVRVRDRLTDREYVIRAKYVIGADGARSKVAADLSLPFEGRMDIAGSMSIVLKADVAHLFAHRPSSLYWVIQPGSNVGGVGAGVIGLGRRRGRHRHARGSVPVWIVEISPDEVSVGGTILADRRRERRIERRMRKADEPGRRAGGTATAGVRQAQPGRTEGPRGRRGRGCRLEDRRPCGGRRRGGPGLPAALDHGHRRGLP